MIEIKVPPLGESVTEATIARWLKSAGQEVSADEVLIELETEKVTLEVYSPSKGVLSEVLFKQGDTVVIDQILGKIDANGNASEVNSAQTDSAQESPSKKEDIQRTAPSAKKISEENGIDLKTVKSEDSSIITKSDVLSAISGPSSSTGIATTSSEGNIERVKMTKLRQKVAERLKSAQTTAAILTTFNEVDMSAVSELRQRYKDTFEKKYQIKLGFMSFFVKAAIQALKEWPVVNASIEGDEIIYKHFYDISVAVSAPQGLVVPVIRNADQMNFVDIEKEIANLGQKARENKLTVAELMGGTFTISNGGIFGSLLSTPILNPPQSAILGMHKIQERPIAINGKVEIRPMMYLALSYDHRLIDGREAVSFLVRVKECIENPERLLLEI